MTNCQLWSAVRAAQLLPLSHARFAPAAALSPANYCAPVTVTPMPSVSSAQPMSSGSVGSMATDEPGSLWAGSFACHAARSMPHSGNVAGGGKVLVAACDHSARAKARGLADVFAGEDHLIPSKNVGVTVEGPGDAKSLAGVGAARWAARAKSK